MVVGVVVAVAGMRDAITSGIIAVVVLVLVLVMAGLALIVPAGTLALAVVVAMTAVTALRLDVGQICSHAEILACRRWRTLSVGGMRPPAPPYGTERDRQRHERDQRRRCRQDQ